jgi:hypothetical protein
MASNIAFTVRYRASSKFNVDALLKRSFVDVLNAKSECAPALQRTEMHQLSFVV